MSGFESPYWNRSRISRRSLLRGGTLAGLGLAGAALIGCGGGEEEPTDSGSNGGGGGGGATSTAASNPTTSTETAKVGGTLRAGISLGPERDSLDINTGGAGTIGQHYVNQIWDTLLMENDEKDIIGHIAESFEQTPDYLSTTFKIRQGVTFHDGTPLNAESVKFMFDRRMPPVFKDTNIGPAYESNEVVDEFTIKLNLNKPYHNTLRRLTRVYYAIPSPSAVKVLGKDGEMTPDAEFARHPVASGPFVFKNWVQSSEINVERFPDYTWGPSYMSSQGPAHLDGIRFLELPDSDARYAALQAGDVDLIDDVPAVQVQNIKDNSDLKTFEWVQGGHTVALELNNKLSPTDDLRVRQAINHTVDKQEVSSLIYFDVYDLAYGPLASSTPGYNDGLSGLYPHDLEKAAQLLDAAGWVSEGGGTRMKDGQPLHLTHLTAVPDVAVLVQTHLAKVGIDSEIVVLPRGTAHDDRRLSTVDHIYDPGRPKGFTSEDPDTLQSLYHSRFADGVNTQATFIGQQVPELDQVLLEQSQIPHGPERIELVKKAQELIMQNAVIVPLLHGKQIVGAKQNVQNVRVGSANYYLQFHDTWLA